MPFLSTRILPSVASMAILATIVGLGAAVAAALVGGGLAFVAASPQDAMSNAVARLVMSVRMGSSVIGLYFHTGDAAARMMRFASLGRCCAGCRPRPGRASAARG